MSLFVPTVVVLAVTAGVAAGHRRLRPPVAAVALALLAVASVVAVAGSTAAVLATRIGNTPLLAQPLGWCRQVAGAWPTQAVALVAGAALAVALANMARTARRHRRQLAALGPQALVVVDDATPAAFALPRRGGGQVVVTTGMLATLTGRERAALFAHERAHLRHRHHLLLRAVTLAAAGLPILRPLVPRVRFATERWADEAAAAEVGDREVVASALSRAALAAAGTPLPAGALAIADHGVDERISALTALPVPAGPVVAPLAATAVSAFLALTQVHHLVTLVSHLC